MHPYARGRSPWRGKGMLSGFAAILMTILLSTTAYATPQEEYQENLEMQNQLQIEMQQTQEEMERVQAEKDALQSEFSALQAQIEQYQEQMDILDEEIASLQEELDGRQMELDDKYNVYHMHIRMAEEYGTSSYWSLIFQSDSLIEMLNRIDYVSEVMEYQESAIIELEYMIKQLTVEQERLNGLKADRNFASTQTKLLQNKLHATIEARLEQLRELENITAAQLQEMDALTEYGNELLSRIQGEDYDGSSDPDYLYQKYVVETGEATRTPLGAEIVKYTLQYVGGDYVWGGATPEVGFDCSGMLYYVYGQFGYSIMRTARVQYKYSGVKVDFDELQAGDLVFFHPPGETEISHVGMYIGGGLFVHAANSKAGIIVSSLYSNYYSANYYGAKRII